MGSSDLVVGEDHLLDRVVSGITGKRAGEARLPFGSSSRRGKILFEIPAVLQKYPLVEMTSGDNVSEKSGVKPIEAV